MNNKTITVAPYESMLVNGIVRNIDPNLGSVVTENTNMESNYAVCPILVKPISGCLVAKVPVEILNISAKTIFIKPSCDTCHINEVKVIDNLLINPER